MKKIDKFLKIFGLTRLKRVKFYYELFKEEPENWKDMDTEKQWYLIGLSDLYFGITIGDSADDWKTW